MSLSPVIIGCNDLYLYNKFLPDEKNKISLPCFTVFF